MTILLTLALNVSVVLVLFFLLSRRLQKRVRPDAVLEEMRGEIENIITELNQTTDRNIGLIEDRVQKLQSLLETADKRIGIMKREVEKKSTGTATYNDILKRSSARRLFASVSDQGEEGAAQTPGTSGTSGEATSSKKTTSRSAAASAENDTPEHTPERKPEQKPEETSKSRPKQSEYQARRRQIVDLHRKGIAPNLIATRVGSTIGEVELVISLEDRKR